MTLERDEKKKPPRRLWPPGGFIRSSFENPTFSFFPQKVRGWIGRLFVNEG
jgi:hypothetical protein